MDTTALDRAEFKNALLEKLQEEVEEVAAEKSESAFTEELADVLEVLRALAHNGGISFDEIETLCENKRKEKGGFTTPIRVNTISLEASHPDVTYYESKKEKYPEVM